MQIVSDRRGWWIVWEARGEEHADGPFSEYAAAKAAMDECERAEAEDAGG